jgi:NitT/TauT family transport system substrate-binding protein
MLKRRSLLAIGVAMTCLGLGLSSVVQAAELTKASLRLKWLPQTQFAGFYVAQAKGYYRDEGIDLTINPGGPNLLTENLVASGTDTFGLSGGTDSVFAARAKKLPIICIGVAHQLTPFVFVSKKDGPVKTLEDFRGRNVTTWFTGSNYVLLGMLADKNIAQKDVKIQPQQVSVTPFVDGDVDVVTATWYNELDTLKTRMGAENLRLFVAEDYGITFPRDTLITSEKVAKENPELVKAFLRATLRGWKDAIKDPKNAVDTVMAVAPTLERPHQEAMLTEAVRLMEAGSAKENGLLTIDATAVQKAHDFLLKYNVIPEAVDLKAAFHPEFLESIPAADRKL